MTQLRIGDLARLGGVSVRMLRHYHELGLLVPAHVDGQTGYRSYDLGQLDALRRIVELRQLGLSLTEIAPIVAERCSNDELVTVLRRRRDVLAAEISQARINVHRIDEYLNRLEHHVTIAASSPSSPSSPSSQSSQSSPSSPSSPSDATTHEIEVELKPVEARLVAQLSAVAESWAPADIGPVIQPLYPELVARLASAGIAVTGPSTAWYEDTDEGRVVVHATLTIGGRPTVDATSLGFEIVELPAIATVAATIHRGTMDDCDRTYQALLGWVDRHGWRAVGYSREIDIDCGPDRAWITELQLQVERADVHTA